jgi:hypothetical protein
MIDIKSFWATPPHNGQTCFRTSVYERNNKWCREHRERDKSNYDDEVEDVPPTSEESFVAAVWCTGMNQSINQSIIIKKINQLFL